MARLARVEVFSPDEVAILHVVNRVVRRCFLMGTDEFTGKNYDYRKLWVENELKRLAAEFGVDLLAFSILSNHFHLILRSRPDVVSRWDDTEVARRWLRLCPIVKEREEPPEFELNSIRPSAQRRVQALQAEMVASHKETETTESNAAEVNAVSIGQIAGQSTSCAMSSRKDGTKEPDAFLAPVEIDEKSDELGPRASLNGARCSDKGFLPLPSAKYLELLDWTAAELASGKRGSTPMNAPAIFERLSIEPGVWCELVGEFGRLFSLVAGKPVVVEEARTRIRRRRHRLRKAARELLAV